MTIKQPKPRGGAHNVKPPELRRKQANFTLAPQTIELLKQKPAHLSRGAFIDQLVKEYFERQQS